MTNPRLTTVLILAATLASSGCIGRWFNRCGPPCERPFRPLQRLHALSDQRKHDAIAVTKEPPAACPPESGFHPVKKPHALSDQRMQDAIAADRGPHPITPPHSRFHPVPTHPVFAGYQVPVGGQDTLVGPDGRGGPPLERI